MDPARLPRVLPRHLAPTAGFKQIKRTLLISIYDTGAGCVDLDTWGQAPRPPRKTRKDQNPEASNQNSEPDKEDVAQQHRNPLLMRLYPG